MVKEEILEEMIAWLEVKPVLGIVEKREETDDDDEDNEDPVQFSRNGVSVTGKQNSSRTLEFSFFK